MEDREAVTPGKKFPRRRVENYVADQRGGDQAPLRQVRLDKEDLR